MKKLLTVLFCAIFFASCGQQETVFPSKPITIIVPWAAGGGTDGLARELAKQATDIFGVQVNVLNKVGGTGTMGHSYGANTAHPDGYTVTMITYELVTYAPLNRAKIGVEDFKPIMQLNYDPSAITVHRDSPFKTLKDFINHAKANPGKLTIGNSGPGAVWHLGAVKLEKAAGVKFTHIPHDGAKPAVTQLVGQHLDAVSVSPAEVLQYVKEGSLRCLAIMSDERNELLSDIPTFKEEGFDLEHGTWRGLAVPKDTPDDIVQTLTDGFKKAFDSQAFKDQAKKTLLGLKYRDANEFNSFLATEAGTVADLVTELDI